jgi:non-ribosomal peptide synthetase-like protein
VGKSVDVLPSDLVEPSIARTRHVESPTVVERVFAEVLADVVGRDRVAVDSHFFDDLGADSMVMARFCARLRKRPDLPPVSMTDIYRYSTIESLATALTDPVPIPVEWILAEILADLMGVERIAVDSQFFDELGADSMVMAQFCARVRKRPDLPSVSMKDIYRHSTIGSLATALAGDEPAPAETSTPAPVQVTEPASRGEYVLCAVLQLLTFLAYTALAAFVTERGYEWISAASGVLDVYVRSLAFGGAAVVGACILPILLKWVVVGRWKPRQIRVWSLAYVRFWLAKAFVRSNPLLLLIGGRSRSSASSPLYTLYLRALGAKVGRDVAIFSRNVPVCTDMLTIGDGTVIRKDAYFNGYRALNGMIQTGPVTLGNNALVGEMSVLDIDTTIGAGAELGHASSLLAGQQVPDGEIWHGSPAQRTHEGSYRLVDSVHCGPLRRTLYGVLQLLAGLFVYTPVVIGGLALLVAEVPQVSALLDPGPMVFSSWDFYKHALIISAVLFFGVVLVGLLVVVSVPRALSRAVKPDRTYRLYGFHYGVQRLIARLTNSRFFTYLFGDSSYIVNYLRWIGYKFPDLVQTGSNFGMEVKHENPFLSTIGSGTMVADGLSVMNAEFSNDSFRLTHASIGSRNFIGNWICYPAQGRTGDNCLLATKVMVPVTGPVRQGVGLLGAPAFDIPRSVHRDTRMDLTTADELPRRLAMKDRYNAISMGIYLLVRWFNVFVITLLALGAVDLYPLFGALSIAIGSVFAIVFSVSYLVLVERLVAGFKDLHPRYCSIYDPYFWWHERYWKLSAQPRILDGTPFKSLAWRLLGVRIGKRVFDDGCSIIEKTMVALGDHATLNAGSRIQCHSQEDGAFKSDRITIGAGCTLGTSSLVHYGVTMGDGSELAPDAFLLKGEEIPERARWAGNPAREMRREKAFTAGRQGTPAPADPAAPEPASVVH